MKRIAVVISLIIVGGCGIVGGLHTPSGKPEVTVHASLLQALKETEHWLLKNGYVVSDTEKCEALIAQEFQKRPTGRQDLVTGHPSSDDNYHLHFLLFSYEQPDSITITIFVDKTTYSTTHKSSVRQHSQADFDEMQQALITIAQNLSASK